MVNNKLGYVVTCNYISNLNTSQYGIFFIFLISFYILEPFIVESNIPTDKGVNQDLYSSIQNFYNIHIA